MLWVLHTFQKEIFSGILTFVCAAMFYLFRSRVRLLWSCPHQFTFLLNNTPQASPATFLVKTQSVFLTNAGRLPATEVELTFNYPPANLNFWPLRSYDVITSPDNRYTLRFSNLAPKEAYRIELLSVGQDIPGLMNVRSKEGVGKQIIMQPLRIFPKWFYMWVWSLIFLGASSIFYVLIKVYYLMLG